MEARRRAGTLMGGESAGGQGEVRIWIATRRRRQLIAPALVVLCYSVSMGAMLLLPHLHLTGASYWAYFWSCFGGMMLASVGFGIAFRSVGERYFSRLWPSYLSTDDAGIAFVAAPMGVALPSVALPWHEIIGLQRFGSCTFIFYTRSLGIRSVSLLGFPGAEVKSLVSLIQTKADLAAVSRHDPDPPVSFRNALAALDQSLSRTFRLETAALFQSVVGPGPLYARRGETIESILASRDRKCLPNPEGEEPPESADESESDAAGLR